MEPGLEAHARAVFAKAGIAVTDEDLALVLLIHAGYEASSAVLDQIDPAQFPYEPIDPSRAPER
ncbi:MAG TPA: hypothetical protein VFV00_15235 [Acidimicrobiales bacterium]|nr:hypothetical protein [Acidimicrobiales bacterium]